MSSIFNLNIALLDVILVLQVIVIGLLLFAPTVEKHAKRMKADEEEHLARVAANQQRARAEQAQADGRDRMRDIANQEKERLAALRRVGEDGG